MVLTRDLTSSVIESVADGDGIRLVVFLSGCSHHCKGCHNQETWNIKNGTSYDVKEVSDYLLYQFKNGKYSGITLSGGDPLYQKDETLKLIKNLRSEVSDINIWLYTGFLFENVDNDILSEINVLVDGKYDETLPKAKFRGSSNQKIIYLEKGE